MDIDITEPVPGDSKFGKLAPMLVTPLRVFGKLDPTGITQQLLTNCPLPALLSAMAHASPERLAKMIRQVEHGTPRTAWFYGSAVPEGQEPLKTSTTFIVKFQHRAVEITPRLYLGSHNQPRFTMVDDGSGWASYIEKAYVSYRAGYHYSEFDLLGRAANPLSVERIVEDVATDFDMIDITNNTRFRDFEPVSPDPPPGYLEDFQSTDSRRFRGTQGTTRALEALLKNVDSRPTIATSRLHTRSVIGFSDNKVLLYDAIANRQPAKFNMELRHFVAQHDRVYQVR